MSKEALKDQARRHEQREDWAKALEVYAKVIQRQEGSDDPDIALHNRVGDLHVRLGNIRDAVSSYERAIDLYLDVELPNNAVAICRKIIRNDPTRAEAFLRLGRLRAEQGFVVDARENFLTYAELMQGRGKSDEAFGALEEFVELAPRDVDTRLFVAEQLVARGREEDALQHFSMAYSILARDGEQDRAAGVLERLHAIDPDHPVPDPAAAESAIPDAAEAGGLMGFETTALGGEESGIAVSEAPDDDTDDDAEADDDLSFSDIAFGEADGEEEAEEPLPAFDEPAETVGEAAAGEEDEAPAFGDFELEVPALEEAAEEEDSDDADLLPTIDLGEEEEDDTVDFGLELSELEDEDEEEAEPLPTMDLGEDDESADAPPDFGLELSGVAEAGAGAEDEIAPFEVEPQEAEPQDAEPEEAEPLPTMEDAGEELPAAMEFAEDDAGDVEDAEPLPTIELEGPDEATLRERVGADPADGEAWRLLGEALLSSGKKAEGIEALERAHPLLAERGRHRDAIKAVQQLLRTNPDQIELHRRAVEYAHETDQRSLLVGAFLELAEALARAGERIKADAVFERVLSLDPGNARARQVLGGVAASGSAAAPAGPARVPGGDDEDDEYVDLASLVMDGGEESSTRWVVVADAPTGDEQADFARMLSQFKEKVSQNLAQDDATSHYDLGTAYKEMGLLEEAIGEFQLALKARPDHLPTIEMLGQCFLDKGEAQAAVRTLERGVELPVGVEDELLGVYYFLGRAHERIGNTDSAKEFYEKIFTLDINFEDVTERLRILR